MEMHELSSVRSLIISENSEVGSHELALEGLGKHLAFMRTLPEGVRAIVTLAQSL